MAILFSQPCPDCNRPVEFKFGLLIDGVLGLMLFAKCEWCDFRGDPRSNRFLIPLDEDDYLYAAYNGLYIARINGFGEDEENIIDELDDDEEPSRIGFRKENE